MVLALVLASMGGSRVATAQTVTKLNELASPASATSEPFLLGPPTDGTNVVVRASFYVRDINDIDDESETFEFSGVLKLTWHDERQAFDPARAGVAEKIYQGQYQFNEVYPGWFPQVVLVNESGLYETHGVVLRVQADGTLTLLQTVNAVAEADLKLRRYPFDRHRMDATFEALGADSGEVVFRRESDPARQPVDQLRMPQWHVTGVSTSTRERRESPNGRESVASSVFVVSMDVQRDYFFMVRLVVVPLALIVMLSWSVFWMERSSLGDRISVSFIGILTAVAYQIVVSEILPQISYITLMHGFLNLSFFIMCATVLINLVVGQLDQQGKPEAGDRIDRRCRWIFPLTYFGLILVMVGLTFAFF